MERGCGTLCPCRLPRSVIGAALKCAGPHIQTCIGSCAMPAKQYQFCIHHRTLSQVAFRSGTAPLKFSGGRQRSNAGRQRHNTLGGPGADAFMWCELKWASNNTSLSLTASSEDDIVGLFRGTGSSVIIILCGGSAGCCSVVADSSGPCPSCGMCCFAD